MEKRKGSKNGYGSKRAEKRGVSVELCMCVDMCLSACVCIVNICIDLFNINYKRLNKERDYTTRNSSTVYSIFNVILLFYPHNVSKKLAET